MFVYSKVNLFRIKMRPWMVIHCMVLASWPFWLVMMSCQSLMWGVSHRHWVYNYSYFLINSILIKAGKKLVGQFNLRFRYCLFWNSVRFKTWPMLNCWAWIRWRYGISRLTALVALLWRLFATFCNLKYDPVKNCLHVCILILEK